MRVFLTILALVFLPAIAFFLWAWLRAMARERRLAGTLPVWQELPWTWLIIAGLGLAVVGFLYMVLVSERPPKGYFGPSSIPVPPASSAET